ncbi:YkgJ family cysteine cluster protein [Paraliomyxa miuraensis]|uniref:YkgJ family cysteine cluster protein n=1 Tax=Paraliomyxa miuraensis TaxID=376150 RepID=UPI00225216CB|nr:YkgJ family cysteine cluster protein [Paraliomyxa miuraensis]MCX4244422.1 YkgJ family cysteine cluster protein [Paraliomyxa miuraensis]
MTEPHARDHAGAALLILRRRVDDHFTAAKARSPGAMQCRTGCAACCHQRFGVFEIEAHRVRVALARLARADPALRERVRRQAGDPGAAHHCALLVDDRCTIYEERPLICRGHGLPTRVPGEGLQGCPLNFTTEDPPAQSVLDLSAVNAPLSVMARMWDGEGHRVALSDLAAADDVLDDA